MYRAGVTEATGREAVVSMATTRTAITPCNASADSASTSHPVWKGSPKYTTHNSTDTEISAISEPASGWVNSLRMVWG